MKYSQMPITLTDPARKRLRVAIVTSIHPDFDFRVWRYASSLARSGCHVHLVCPWNIQNNTIVDGVYLHTFSRVHKRILRPLLVPLRVMRTLLSILDKIDVIHFQDMDILPWMALMAPRKPVIYDVHENYADDMLIRDWIPWFLRRPLYLIVKLSHVIFPLIIKNVVLVAPYQENEFKNKRLNKIHMVNFASIQLLNDFQDNYLDRNDLVIFTGSHYDENGSLLLLDIATEIEKRGVLVEIAVTDRFSSVTYRNRFEAEVKKRGLTCLQIIECVPSYRIMSILNEATIAILPILGGPRSIKGIPTRLFEFMAAGLPIVASDVGYQADVLRREANGLLACPEHPSTFVDAIERLLDDKTYAKRLGENGQRAFVERYSWESQIPTLLKFYTNILAQRE